MVVVDDDDDGNDDNYLHFHMSLPQVIIQKIEQTSTNSYMKLYLKQMNKSLLLKVPMSSHIRHRRLQKYIST